MRSKIEKVIMLKFSAGYVGVNPNFVIQNIKSNKSSCGAVFSVLSNILQRGCPTLPSKYLEENFGKPQVDKFRYLLSFDNCVWRDVIRGGDTTNPALEFYNDMLPKIFGRLSKTFIAECPLSNIIQGIEDGKNFEYVDFYSPAYNTVIEIDGSQHNSNKEQIIKDINRDKALIYNDVNVVRLSTQDLNDLEVVKKKLKKVEQNEEYFKIFSSTKNMSGIEKNYCIAIRIQMLLLSLYKNGYFNLKEKKIVLNVFCPENVDKSTFEVSAKDFLMWTKQICLLHNIEFEIPALEVNLASSEVELAQMKGTNVVCCLKDVYSQIYYDNVFYIKNDHFLYEENLIPNDKYANGTNSFLFKKNYFSVDYHGVNYKLTKEKHEEALKFVLQNTSVYREFRANQLDIVIECLNNGSVIGVLPTGAGKSLCYQFASLLIPANTLVVAPLQLLMVDQFNNIKEKWGMTNVAYINADKKENINIFVQNKSIITIVSPERFFSDKFTNALLDGVVQVRFVVIDEAHCLSEWGHDFRTSYLCLSHNLSRFLPSSAFLMALTGTASHRVFEDIDCEFQNFKKKKTRAIFAEDMRRENLTIFIQKTDDKYKELIDNISPTLLGINKDKTLVFTKKKRGWLDKYDSACITLEETIKGDELLKGRINEDILTYYAGGDDTKTPFSHPITAKDKEKALLDFKSGQVLVVLATKAFGMGVDIPDIRKRFTMVYLLLLRVYISNLVEREEMACLQNVMFIFQLNHKNC